MHFQIKCVCVLHSTFQNLNGCTESLEQNKSAGDVVRNGSHRSKPAVAPKEKPRTADPSGYFIKTKVLKENLSKRVL